MADAVSDGIGQVVIHLPRPQQEREPAAAPQLLEHACGKGGVRDKGDRRGSQARKRGKRQRMGKLLEKARKDNEHQRTDENRLELDVQPPSRNDERHDRRANEITAATTIAKGHRWGWRVPDGRHALPYACGLAYPPGSIPMGDKAAHVGDAAFWG